MGVEQVYPGKERPSALALPVPAEEGVDDGVRRALGVGAGRASRPAHRRVVVVEALVQAEGRVEHDGCQEGGGLDASLARALGQGHGGWR